MILFAQTPAPDVNIAWNVMLTLGVLVAIGANVVAVFQRRRTTLGPLPVPVQNVAGAATTVELEKVCAQNDRVHEQFFTLISSLDRRSMEAQSNTRLEMHGMELRINATAEERTTKVHERINLILAAENETRGTLAEVSKSLDALAAEVRGRN